MHVNTEDEIYSLFMTWTAELEWQRKLRTCAGSLQYTAKNNVRQAKLQVHTYVRNLKYYQLLLPKKKKKRIRFFHDSPTIQYSGSTYFSGEFPLEMYFFLRTFCHFTRTAPAAGWLF